MKKYFIILAVAGSFNFGSSYAQQVPGPADAGRIGSQKLYSSSSSCRKNGFFTLQKVQFQGASAFHADELEPAASKEMLAQGYKKNTYSYQPPKLFYKKSKMVRITPRLAEWLGL